MKNIFVIGFLLILSHCSFAQSRSSISFGSGSATYLGELNPYNAPIHSLLGLASRWNVGCSYLYNINKNIQLSSSFNFIRLFGDDNLLVPKNKNKELNYLRNLHFRNDLKEISLSMQYIFINTNGFDKQSNNIQPFITAGIALFNHNPKAKEPIVDLSYLNDWVSLRSQKNEGQTVPYANWGLSCPIGFGFNKRINRSLGVQIDFLYRFTFTDYLDDVSTKFSSQASNAIANRSAEIYAAYSKKDRSAWLLKYLSNEGFSTQYANQISKEFRNGIPPLNTDGAMRGNPNVKDSYFTTKVSVVYYFNPKVRCPKII